MRKVYLISLIISHSKSKSISCFQLLSNAIIGRVCRQCRSGFCRFDLTVKPMTRLDHSIATHQLLSWWPQLSTGFTNYSNPLPGGTPEGTRYAMVATSFELVAATVHRTVAFNYSSPFLYRNTKRPDTTWYLVFLVHRKGLEPPTLGTGIRCSIH